MFPIQGQLQVASSSFQLFVEKHLDKTTELVNQCAKAVFLSAAYTSLALEITQVLPQALTLRTCLIYSAFVSLATLAICKVVSIAKEHIVTKYPCKSESQTHLLAKNSFEKVVSNSKKTMLDAEAIISSFESDHLSSKDLAHHVKRANFKTDEALSFFTYILEKSPELLKEFFVSTDFPLRDAGINETQWLKHLYTTKPELIESFLFCTSSNPTMLASISSYIFQLHLSPRQVCSTFNYIPVQREGPKRLKKEFISSLNTLFDQAFIKKIKHQVFLSSSDQTYFLTLCDVFPERAAQVLTESSLESYPKISPLFHCFLSSESSSKSKQDFMSFLNAIVTLEADKIHALPLEYKRQLIKKVVDTQLHSNKFLHSLCIEKLTLKLPNPYGTTLYEEYVEEFVHTLFTLQSECNNISKELKELYNRVPLEFALNFSLLLCEKSSPSIVLKFLDFVLKENALSSEKDTVCFSTILDEFTKLLTYQGSTITLSRSEVHLLAKFLKHPLGLNALKLFSENGFSIDPTNYTFNSVIAELDQKAIEVIIDTFPQSSLSLIAYFNKIYSLKRYQNENSIYIFHTLLKDFESKDKSQTETNDASGV